MSELDDRPTAGGAGGAPAAADPLARIGARLIAAEHGRRRRRRHARQRLAGGAVTLLLVVAAVVVARPFAGGDGSRKALTNRGVELSAGDGQFIVYATGERTICAKRPNGRDRAGTTICAWSGMVIELLERHHGIAWVQARAVGDRVVVTGLASRTVDVTATVTRPGGGVGTAESSAGGPTVTVGKMGGPPLVARPFSLSLPRTAADYVQVAVPSGPDVDLVTRVEIGAAAPSGLSGYEQLHYAVDGAASVAEAVQSRLMHLSPPPGGRNRPTRSQVLGDGNRLTVWVPGGRADAARLALQPGTLRVYDWEASALLPDDTTVAQGQQRGVPRATTISRGAGSATGLTLAEARAQQRRLGGTTRIVQAIGPRENGLPLRRDDPRARFYVVRGRPALSGAWGVVVGPLGSRGGVGVPPLSFKEGQLIDLRRVTRTVSQRGQDMMLPGTPSSAVVQHLAVVLDDRVVALSQIDPVRLPDGVSGNTIVLPDWFIRRGMRELTDKLALGPLPPLTEIR